MTTIKWSTKSGVHFEARLEKHAHCCVWLVGSVDLPCGFLRDQRRFAIGIDRGWVTGEYGERMTKPDCLEFARALATAQFSEVA